MSQFIQRSAIIPHSYQGMRIDRVLAQLFPEYSRARLSKWLKEKYITVAGKQLQAKDKVYGGELIEINAFIIDLSHWQPQAIDLDIIFEDESLIVINKPVGLVVHPAAGNPENTLVNALLHHCPMLASLPRAGLIHRLDKDTSGLLIIAKTLTAHTYLVAAMQHRFIKREYLALVYGKMALSTGTINAPIARHPRNRLKMAVVKQGKAAVTHYQVKQQYECCALLQITLDTGRTHQIRVHLTHNHHPLVGDQLYQAAISLPKPVNPSVLSHLKNFKRQALHAFRLSFTHPVSNNPLQFISPLPHDIQQLLDILDDAHAP